MKTKKRILATAVLTTAAVMQLMTTAMAKETSNSATDSRSDSYSNTAHTTFGVIETDQDVSGQVSFEVPLFVTMAATPGRHNMLLPTEDQYYIENTSGDIKDADTVIETNPIGVTSVIVKGLPTNTWEIVGTKFTDASKDKNDNHKMTFTIAEMDLVKAGGTSLKNQFETILYDNSATTTGWKQLQTKNQFVNIGDYDINGDQTAWGNSLVKIGRKADRIKIKLDSTIANLEKKERANNGNTASTGLFKVQYTLAALDKNGQPKLAAVYAGDDWIDAGYKTNPTNTKN